MNEKAYKAMGLAGAAGIAVGIVVTVIGIAAGVISIISGARLLKKRKESYSNTEETQEVVGRWIQGKENESGYWERYYLYYM